MRKSLALVLSLVAWPVSAQQVMDASGAPYGEDIATKIAAAMIGTANDPFSAQIVRLKPSTGSDDVICGLLNLKNASGGYTGFQPFYFNVKTRTIGVEVSSGCM